MSMLLVPQTSIDVAPVEQLIVPTDVVNLAAFEHEDRVGVDQ
jgi:hypothetical protein